MLEILVLLLIGIVLVSSYVTSSLKGVERVNRALYSRSSYKKSLCVMHGLGLGASGSSSQSKQCKVCSGKGGMNCKPCGGKGIDKINGSVLERWTCKKCKGFGFVPCTACNSSSRGLTPEQTGER